MIGMPYKEKVNFPYLKVIRTVRVAFLKMLDTLLVLPDCTLRGLIQACVCRAHKFAVESGHKGAAAVIGILAPRLQQAHIAHGVT